MQKGQTLIFLLAGILIIAVAGGAYYLGRSSTPKPSPTPVVTSQTSQPTSTPSLTQDKTANWKTYKNNILNFSFQYPPSWNKKDFNDRGLNGVDVQGPEGNLHVAWGSGFGGGCDQQYHESVKLNQQNFDSCHTKNTDSSELWKGIGKTLSNNISIDISATASSGANKDLILQILSTFKFIP